MSQPQRTVGIIGGSGLYAMEGLEKVRSERVETNFGAPSDEVLVGELGATRLLFLPRHGRGHRIPPHRINYRANILALKQLGAEMLVSVSAVGSMKEDIAPGDLVLVDQFIDRTRSRPNTFFDGEGVVAHVGFADPVDRALVDCLEQSAQSLGLRVHRGGTYLCIEGPQFSTRAESQLYRSWGVSVIGMTNMPEARLAREAELPYACLALATDYDCWRQAEPGGENTEAVSVEAVVAVLQGASKNAQAVLRQASLRGFPDPAGSPASHALQHALMSDLRQISPENRQLLAPLLRRYWS